MASAGSELDSSSSSGMVSPMKVDMRLMGGGSADSISAMDAKVWCWPVSYRRNFPASSNYNCFPIAVQGRVEKGATLVSSFKDFGSSTW